MGKFLKKMRSTPFTAREAAMMGVGQYQLQRLLDQGVIEKMRRGVYQKAKDEWNQEDSFRAVISHLTCPSCVCLWSALSYYQLTEEVPNEVWVYVPFGKYSHSSGIRVVRQRKLNLKIGVVKKRGYRITSLERTVVEALISAKQIPKREAVEALKISLREKKTTMAKLVSMAKELGVFHRVRVFLEVFA